MCRFVLALSAIVVLLTGCVSSGTPGVQIPIANPSFESPEVSGNGGEHIQTTDWISGGSWYGRFRWHQGVKDGDWAVWSSFQGGGPENGYSQLLTTTFQAGTYVLSVWASGDNKNGLKSRLILGYQSDSGEITEIAHGDTAAGHDMMWVKQVLKVSIDEKSPAVGKPIRVRMTGTAIAVGTGGNSNWWDGIRLLYYAPTPSE